MRVVTSAHNERLSAVEMLVVSAPELPAQRRIKRRGAFTSSATRSNGASPRLDKRECNGPVGQDGDIRVAPADLTNLELRR